MRYFILILFLLFGSYSATAQVYKWVDEDGRTHYSDKPPASELDAVEQTSSPKKQVFKTKHTPEYPKEIVTFKVQNLLKTRSFMNSMST